ncbi:MAG: FeoB-associated Cys-rich membrane protein [Chitinophagaceae bacterium]|nr:MAG: FeoB-associated Cys-rich membrane protein [Chitinophagaceae bacterium]
MDIQLILVIVLFLAAAFYIGRMVFRSVFAKKPGCGTACKCSADLSNIPTPRS